MYSTCIELETVALSTCSTRNISQSSNKGLPTPRQAAVATPLLPATSKNRPPRHPAPSQYPNRKKTPTNCDVWLFLPSLGGAGSMSMRQLLPAGALVERIGAYRWIGDAHAHSEEGGSQGDAPAPFSSLPILSSEPALRATPDRRQQSIVVSKECHHFPSVTAQPRQSKLT